MLRHPLRPPLTPPLRSPLELAATNAGQWTPLSLGANLAAWYDPNDLNSLWQDTAGSTPATVNTLVGRISDKSGGGYHLTQATPSLRPALRGSPTGPNLIADPHFYTGAGWTFGAGWTQVTPHASASSASAALSNALTAVVGKVYLVKMTVQSRTAGSVELTFGGVSMGALSSAVSRSRVITATSTAALSIAAIGFSGAVRSVSVQDISAGQVTAPYWLEFDGVDDCLVGSAMVTAYPVTMMSRHYVDGSAVGALGILSLWENFPDNKHLRAFTGTADWKESFSGTNITGEADIACTMRGSFVSGLNRARQAFSTEVTLAHSNTFGAKTSFFIGKARSADMYFAGRFYGAIVCRSDLSSGEAASANIFYASNYGIEAWGDSMTAGTNGALVNGGWVTRMRGMIERRIGNQGGSGQTSTQIRARFEAASADSKRLTQIFWMGTNNAADPMTVKADIAACVAGLNGHARYLVIPPHRSAGNALPAAAYAALESDLAALYGERYLNLRTALNAYHDGSANDLADIADGLVPRSLRLPSDAIHLNDLGNQRSAEVIYAKLQALVYLA